MIFWKHVAIQLTVLAASVIWLWIGIMGGRSEVMRGTVVEFERPYYRGVYYGKCAEVDGGWACATLPEDH